MTTSTHQRQGITRTIDDAVEPTLIDTGRPYSDTTDAILAAGRALAVLGAKGTATFADVVTFADESLGVVGTEMAAAIDLVDKSVAETAVVGDVIAFAALLGFTVVDGS